MTHHVLLLGGHGKIAQLLTPLLLRRGWAVTSVIRTPEQVPAIQKLADSKGGKLDVLVRSLEEVKSEADAKGVLEEVGADYVVWSAGAGGRGGPERTYALDRDAATHFIHAAAATPRVTRFLLISYLGARRTAPAWWSAAEWAAAQHVNTAVLPHYYAAKVAADEALYAAAKARGSGFVGIDLRPGTLTVGEAGGVELGRTTGSRGEVSRAGVARVADLLLAAEGARSAWLDLLDGSEEAGEAVERVVREGVDAAEGEAVF
ncbi:NAD dependent epimerase dehydratase family protein [Trichocladium antarcticum]|uniref:NAD dependent epimerase dehydratase family protein n=1 Tax=Trichocladium antarcticum TaxID=1450529 RepID=A0AAN6UCR6_9PEZI|nr:NAD dependent epimerase dehydratase family protein [Trichocladium antarcticum]